MRQSDLRAPSPAMVVALLALFVSLGGTGYAASQLTNARATSATKAIRPPGGDRRADRCDRDERDQRCQRDERDERDSRLVAGDARCRQDGDGYV